MLRTTLSEFDVEIDGWLACLIVEIIHQTAYLFSRKFRWGGAHCHWIKETRNPSASQQKMALVIVMLISAYIQPADATMNLASDYVDLYPWTVSER